jgi:hypothetical protein
MWRTRRSRDGDARLEARACVADTRAATRGSPLTLNCDDMPILMSAITCSDFVEVEAAFFVCRVKIPWRLAGKLLGSHQMTLRPS